MAAKDEIIAELRRTNAELLKRIAKLELQLAKAQKNSSNSSMSPSSDIVKPQETKKADRRKKTKRGGQKGHQRNLRELLPADRVDETFVYEMNGADVIELGLTPTDEFEIIQHIELLDMPIYVVEHRLRKYLDLQGKFVLPNVPELNGPIFGPRMLSMIGWLKSGAHCSYTTIAEWMGDILQVPVSRGYLSKLCNGIISESLAGVHDELRQAIPDQPQLGTDESSLKNNGKKHWIWCITAAMFTFFRIASTRSRSVLEEIIGIDYQGIVHCDYFSANCSFLWHFDIKGQYCWAHLIRDIRFLLKHPSKKTKAWAEELQNRSRKIFSSYHRREEMTESGFYRSMVIQRDRFLEIVRKPPDSQEAKNLTDRFRIVEFSEGENIGVYDMSQDYFRFMLEDNVEPTNNHSEQQIRHCVIDRKITQGTRSLKGQRYHERMWTAIATCRKQNRSFFEFLKASIEAKTEGKPSPSLLNNPQH